MSRKFNFYAGPAVLPEAVMAEAKEALWVVGQDREGRRREDRMLLVFELRRPEDGVPEDWLITGIRAEEGRTKAQEAVAPHAACSRAALGSPGATGRR